jgi:6-phosphofructokinase
LIDGVHAGLRELGVRGLVTIGGDGSLSIGQQLFEGGVPLVGVPKTIDNDLEGTVITFGFDSAVACATHALDRLHTTAESNDRVMVREVMGRYAGWIALYARVAGGADVILIPEIPFGYESICAKVREREEAGKRFTLIIAAEGAREKGGELSPRRPRSPIARPGWAASPGWWPRRSRSRRARRPASLCWATCSEEVAPRTSTARCARPSASRPWS